jgi:DNA-binding IclR family transcriptional regulator
MKRPNIVDRPNPTTVASIAEPRSLMRVLGIIHCVAKSKGGMSLATLGLELKSPKSSLFSLLKALASNGYLQRDGDVYKLGPRSYLLGSEIVADFSVRKVARPIMERIAGECLETVMLGILDPTTQTMYCIDTVDNSQVAVRYFVPVGAIRPLYATAGGRLLLAYQTEEYIEDYLRKTPRTRLTDQTILDKDTIKELCEEIRRTQLSESIGGYLSEIAAYASPVFDANDKIAAALIIGGPLLRVKRQRTKLTSILKRAARDISTSLGANVLKKTSVRHARSA